MAMPQVSIIIPTYNDNHRLNLCLGALGAQTYPSELTEVIVVDDGSPESPAEIVSRYPFATLLTQNQLGSYAARNYGLSVAKGEVIGFTDSDCIPYPDWIEKAVARLEALGDGVVVGHVELFPEREDAASPTENFEMLFAFHQKQHVENERYGATANVITTTRVLNDVGHFDAGLRSGGDKEWGNRACDDGFTMIYADDVIVRHPARASIAEISKKIHRVLGGLRKLQAGDQGDPRAVKPSLLKWFKPPLGMLARVLRDPRIKGGWQRLKVCAVVLYFRYTMAFGLLRIRLGV